MWLVQTLGKDELHVSFIRVCTMQVCPALSTMMSAMMVTTLNTSPSRFQLTGGGAWVGAPVAEVL